LVLLAISASLAEPAISPAASGKTVAGVGGRVPETQGRCDDSHAESSENGGFGRWLAGQRLRKPLGI
jgi:hypothetical protein